MSWNCITDQPADLDYAENLVNSEVQYAFSPYGQSSFSGGLHSVGGAAQASRTPYMVQLNSIRSQNAGHPPKRRRTATPFGSLPSETKQLQVGFLGSNDEFFRPNHERRIDLSVSGLGDATITISKHFLLEFYHYYYFIKYRLDS